MPRPALKISIVTPSYNQGEYIEDTILSVLNQKYPNLEYIIIDGGSSDNTIEILKKYGNELVWVSEPDNGMYDAINKGFQMCTGDIMAWINSDDIYYEGSFNLVSNIFTQFTDINWISGKCGYVDEKGNQTHIAKSKLYNAELLENGFYRSPFSYVVNQNVVFWRKRLWDKSGGCNPRFKQAGDFELWTKFAKHTKLYYIDFVFSAFRKHSNQKTNTPQNYLNELSEMIKPSFQMVLSILLGKRFYAPRIVDSGKGQLTIKLLKLDSKHIKSISIIINTIKFHLKKKLKIQ